MSQSPKKRAQSKVNMLYSQCYPEVVLSQSPKKRAQSKVKLYLQTSLQEKESLNPLKSGHNPKTRKIFMSME